MSHNGVGTREISDFAERIRIRILEAAKGRLMEEVAAKEHAVADFLGFEVLGQLGMGEGRVGFDPQHETEPGAVGGATGVIPFEN